MKTLLITGASGVLAKNFINKYSQTYKIIEAVRVPTKSTQIKLNSWEMDTPKTNVDAVLHFAGKYLIDDSRESIQIVNESVVGTAASVSDYCARTKTPLIALGSYFEKAPDEFQPWSYYSSAKTAAYNLLRLSATIHQYAFTYVYCYDTFGEDFARRKIVDVLLDPNTEHLELSEGFQKLNLTYLEDFVDGLNMALINLWSQTTEISDFQIKSDQNEFTMREIAEKINSRRKKKIELVFGAKPYRRREVFSVWNCAPSIPGFEAKTTFDSFIEKYLGSHNV